jgi:catechol 2,3-dioxygenase-like lactoylglutathione lyase family enzyme
VQRAGDGGAIVRELLVGVAVLVACGPLLADAGSSEPRPTAEASVRWLAPRLLVQLQVADLERSIRFYTEVLGFEVTERRDDLQFAHLQWGIPGLELGLSAGGAGGVAPAGVVLNFGIDGDIEAAREALAARGAVFSGPTVVIEGKVRLASFRDPDGHALRLAASDQIGRGGPPPG